MTDRIFKLNAEKIVSVFGGSGFLGSYVVKELAKTGCIIKVISRNPQKANFLKITGAVGQVSLISCNALKEEEVRKAIKGSDVVINLLGILYPKGGQSFDDIHVSAAGNIAKVAAARHVKKFIHVSALGVDRAANNSQYARSKIAGEKEVLKHFENAVIFRPSVIFGPEDNFINMLNCYAKFLPFIPLVGNGDTLLQPIYAVDLAKAIVASITANVSVTEGKTIEVAGPKQISMKQIVELILSITKRRRILLNLPFSLTKIQAMFLELLPNPPLTRDQVELLKYDNTLIGKNGLEKFNITPTHFEPIIRTYLR